MKKYYFLLIAFYCLISGGVRAQYIELFTFDYNTNGAEPQGNLTLVGNKLFGMTEDGGPNYAGNIFSINQDGTGFRVMLDFNNINGANPSGSLTLSGSKLFGMTTWGGAYGYGTVFSIDTTGNNDKVLLSMSGLGDEGQWPNGSLIISGKKLFGVAQIGPYLLGVIFSIDTDGTNYKMLFDFGTGTEGNPSSLLLSGKKLYGTSGDGGIYGDGSVFVLDSDGTNMEDLHDFNDTIGGEPDGPLILLGAKLYGMTALSGIIDTSNPIYYGTVFSIDTTGANYKVLHYFNDTAGDEPFGSLLYSNGKLYGMTTLGGTHDTGIIFSMDTNGTEFKDTYDFTGITGAVPYGSLIISGSKLYGMTSLGGSSDDGVIFSFDTSGCFNAYSELICIVTIDTAINKPEVIWGRTNSPPSGGQGYYNIYKDTTSGYSFIHTQPLDSLSEYIDTTSFPNDGPESYEISTVDSCGESALSSPATTIYLTTTSGINVYILNWTAYVGFTPTLYRIFRGPGMNALVQIDSVPNTVLAFHDTLPPAGSIYLIEAVSPFGVCVPTTHRPGRPSVNLSGSFSNGYNAGALVTGNKSINSFTNLKTFPNPSNGLITLTYSSLESENVQISVINELGQVVYAEQKQGNVGANTEQLNLSNLASGIYTLRMQNNSGITVKKLEIIGK